MGDITSINDEYLQSICNTASISAMDLLEHCEFKSSEWISYISGLSFGIWISLCDPLEISLDDIDDIINEIILTHLN